MTDIVERLRKLSDKGAARSIGELWNACDEAADEIDQLRDRVDEYIMECNRLQGACHDSLNDYVKLLDVRRSLEARIAELEGDKDRATDLNRMLKRNNGALLSQKTAVEHVAKGYGWDEGSDHDQDALGFIIDRIAKLEAQRVPGRIALLSDVPMHVQDESMGSTRASYRAGWNDCRKTMIASAPQPADQSEQPPDMVPAGPVAYPKRSGGAQFCDRHGGYGFQRDCLECNDVRTALAAQPAQEKPE